MLPQGSQVLDWENPYIVTLLLASLSWGIGAVYIMPVDSELHQAVVYFFLMGMSGGAVAVYSAHRNLTLTTIASVLLPATIWLFLQSTLISVGMAVAAAFFMLAVLRSGKVLSDAMHNSFMLSHELKAAKEIAENIAEIDELTGLYNRRVFYNQGKMIIDHSKRSDDSLAMILMDMDNFKDINDTRGHAAGGAALTHVGMMLRKTMRRSDICARIGGEEFGLLLPGSTLEGAVKFAEKLRWKIENQPVSFDGDSFKITASFGVSVGHVSLDILFKHTDAALYQAKESGRNCVVSDEFAGT